MSEEKDILDSGMLFAYFTDGLTISIKDTKKEIDKVSEVLGNFPGVSVSVSHIEEQRELIKKQVKDLKSVAEYLEDRIDKAFHTLLLAKKGQIEIKEIPVGVTKSDEDDDSHFDERWGGGAR